MESYAWSVPECQDAFEALLTCPTEFYFFQVTKDKDDWAQAIVTTTWRDIWEQVASRHWHTVHDARGKPKATSQHTESLAVHLCACAERCYTLAVNQGAAHPVKHFYAGLLHAIGKPGALQVRGKRASFEGHGLMGGALIQDLWSYAVGTVTGLTRDDWADLSTVADVHVCGHFHEMDQPNHLDTFALLPSGARALLPVLRSAELAAPVPHHEARAQTLDEADASYPSQFAESLNLSPDMAQYCQNHNLDHGVMILFQGVDGSGKTELRHRVDSYLRAQGVETVSVVHDDVIVSVVQEHRGLPVTGTDDEYRACYEVYARDEPRFSRHVIDAMKTAIEDGLIRGRVVLVDTMDTMYEKNAKLILPEFESARSFKLALWASRGPVEITRNNSAGRNSLGIQEQLSAHGTRSTVLAPLPQLQAWGDVTSLTEAQLPTTVDMHPNKAQAILKTFERSLSRRPHLSLSVSGSGLKIKTVEHALDHVVAAHRYLATLPRSLTLETSRDLTLAQLVNRLYIEGGIDGLRRFFKRYHYTVSQPMASALHSDKDDDPRDYASRIVGIKYVDGLNREWRAAWAREARGRFYCIRPDASEALPLKVTLQRGVELLTRAHTRSDVTTTQDVVAGSNLHLDDTQRRLLEQFCANEDTPIDGIVTCKVDGCLLLLNLYHRGSEQYAVMCDLLEKIPGTLHFEAGDWLVVPSTQGTLFITEPMTSVMITSLYGELGLPTPSADTPVGAAWAALVETLGARLLALVDATFDNIDTVDEVSPAMLNFAFEMVCADRTSYTGIERTELAVSYPTSFTAFLGVYVVGTGSYCRYFPHADLPATVGLVTHPPALRVTSTQQVWDLVDGLTAVVHHGTLSVDAFTTKHFGRPYPVHAEGFVYLHRLADGTYDYNKLKLPIYYVLHKLKKQHVSSILKLPRIADEHFPTLRSLRSFNDDLPRKLSNYTNALLEYIRATHLAPGSPWIASLPPRTASHFQHTAAGWEASNAAVAFSIIMRDGAVLLLPGATRAAGEHLGLGDAAKHATALTEVHAVVNGHVHPWMEPDAVDAAVTALLENGDTRIHLLWCLLISPPK